MRVKIPKSHLFWIDKSGKKWQLSEMPLKHLKSVARLMEKWDKSREIPLPLNTCGTNGALELEGWIDDSTKLLEERKPIYKVIKQEIKNRTNKIKQDS